MHSPRHVAIIMDGNGRWAKRRYLPRFAGHQQSVESVRTIVKACVEKGIAVLTLFAFSSENWYRPEQEVSFLMSLFLQVLEQEVQRLHQNQVRLRVIGDTSALNAKLQSSIKQAERLTQHNTGLCLNIAANYGGRWDIMQAVKKVAMAVKNQSLSIQDLDEQAFDHYTCLADCGSPDFLIRTGGDQRISNFLLWQLAYTELYFTETLWPDFRLAAFEEALSDFASRERRYGRVNEDAYA